MEMAEAIHNLQIQNAKFEEKFEDNDEYRKKQNGTMQSIDNKLEAIRRELAGRPTWAVLTIITFLTSLCTGMAMFILTR